jgi:hypothetical protein
MSVDTEQHAETAPGSLPPDPAEYDSARAKIARAKGLEAPYIAGGRDPDPEAGLEEERHYGKLLLWMVLALMFGGFVIGIALTLAFGSAL